MYRFEQPEIRENFYKYQIRYFQFLGVWSLEPGANKQQKILHHVRFLIIFILIFIMLLFFSIRILDNINNMREILQVFFMFATEVSVMIKLLRLKLNPGINTELIIEMHSTAFQPKSAEEAKIFKRAGLLSEKVRNYYAAMSILAAALILVTKILVESSALPMAMYEPCNLESLFCFYGLYFYHVLVLMPTCFLNIAFDSLVTSILIFLEAQLAMLALRLESLGAATTPQDNERIAEELRVCCIYYGRIVQLKDLIERFLKVPGSVQLGCSVLVLVANFYDISTNTDETVFVLRTGIYQLAMLSQIFAICYAANEVTHQSTLLSLALYKSQWLTWKESNRKMCLLLMLRFNSQLCVRTLNHTQSFALATFSGIVNCSYSYFALLKRVNS